MIVRTYEEYLRLFDKDIRSMNKIGSRDSSKVFVVDRKLTAIVKGKNTPVFLCYYPYEERMFILIPSKKITSNDISYNYWPSNMVETIQKKTGYKTLFKHSNMYPHTDDYENNEGDYYDSEQQCCDAEFSGNWEKFIKDIGWISIRVSNKYNPYNPILGFKTY